MYINNILENNKYLQKKKKIKKKKKKKKTGLKNNLKYLIYNRVKGIKYLE